MFGRKLFQLVSYNIALYYNIFTLQIVYIYIYTYTCNENWDKALIPLWEKEKRVIPGLIIIVVVIIIIILLISTATWIVTTYC